MKKERSEKCKELGSKEEVIRWIGEVESKTCQLWRYNCDKFNEKKREVQ